MSVVKSLTGAIPPSQLVPVPHKVVPAVELQSITAASDVLGAAKYMAKGRITSPSRLGILAKIGTKPPPKRRLSDFTTAI